MKLDPSTLTDDGDELDLNDGSLKLRLRIEPDDINPFDEFDTYGKVEPCEYRTGTYVGGTHCPRPKGFDGNAEKLHTHDTYWWQPPPDVKRTDEHFSELRDLVKDLIEYGLKYVRLELLEGRDAYGRSIVRNFAGLGGIEPFPKAEYVQEIVIVLAHELGVPLQGAESHTEAGG